MAAGRGCSNGILGRPAGPRTRASAEAASLGAAGRGISRQCPSRHVLLGRTDQVAVAVTGSLRLAPEKPTTPGSNGNPADVIHRQDLTCDADPLSARPVPGF